MSAIHVEWRRTFGSISVAMAATFGLMVRPAAAHPKPGAHADVRINIESDHVRFDLLMNILFVDGLINAPRVAMDDLLPDEEPAVRNALVEYLGGARSGPLSAIVDRPNSVLIDGIPVTPIIRELRVVRPPPEDRPGFVQNPVLLIPRIHAVVDYPAKGAPREVSIVWGTFPRDFISQLQDTAPPGDIEAVVSGEGEFQLVTFRRSEPQFTWRPPARDRDSKFASVPAVQDSPAPTFPLVSTAVIGAWLLASAGLLSRRFSRVRFGAAAAGGIAAALLAIVTRPLARIPAPAMFARHADTISTDAAASVFAPLHANIYRAFDYTAEGDIYDALARSVDGPLLDQIYNQVYTGLVMQEEGGALSRVSAVHPMETSVVSIGTEPGVATPAFVVRTRWRVDGVVYHWGHSHARTNEYAAEYAVAARPGGWKITGCRPLEQRRIESAAQAGSSASVDAGGSASPPKETGAWTPTR